MTDLGKALGKNHELELKFGNASYQVTNNNGSIILTDMMGIDYRASSTSFIHVSPSGELQNNSDGSSAMVRLIRTKDNVFLVVGDLGNPATKDYFAVIHSSQEPDSNLVSRLQF